MKLNELFEKINEKIEIENQIAENYGDATDEQVDFIAEVSAMTEQQIEQLCEWRASKVGELEQCKENSKYFQSKAKRAERTIDFIDGVMVEVMKRTDTKTMDAGRYDVKLKSSWRVDVSVPAEQLPVQYQRVKTTIEADKNAIGDFIKAGGEIDGCQRVENFSVKVN